MELNTRAVNIRSDIIRDYINTAEPVVCSRTLSKDATWVSVQPPSEMKWRILKNWVFWFNRIPVGRIPTCAGTYRYYVDEIMEIQKLEKMIRNDIHRVLIITRSSVQRCPIRPRYSSQLTNYTAVGAGATGDKF